MQLTNDIFKPGICWSVKQRTSQNGIPVPEHLCGTPAKLYKVTGRMSNGSGGGMTVNMWLCDVHAARMKARKYTLVHVP